LWRTTLQKEESTGSAGRMKYIFTEFSLYAGCHYPKKYQNQHDAPQSQVVCFNVKNEKSIWMCKLGCITHQLNKI
jgi:hypothetical protein